MEKIIRKLIVLFCAVSIIIAGLSGSLLIKTEATCSSGIKGNGTGGISININAAPYTTFQTYSYGQFAYGSSGCAWYASARVNQLTGKGNVIRAGSNWWRNNPYNWEKTGGNPTKAPAIVCWQNHIAIVEKIEGGTAYISEGGSGWSDSSHGYCVIRTVSASSISSMNSGYLGSIYIPGVPTPVSASIVISVNDSDIGSWRHNEAVSARTETNWGLYGYVNNPSGATIGQTGVYLYDAAGNLIGQKSEDYDSSSNRMTVAPVFYDINKELGVTLSPGTSYKYKIFAVVGGNRVESEMVTFTTKGSSDTKPPVFEYYKIVEQDSNRYIVECKVSDENGISKVMCPTWTEKNSQDDLAQNWNTNDAVKATACGNGVYKFNVVVSDHNNEHGLYHTHIYAFDAYGNASSVALSTILERAMMPKVIKRYNNTIYSVYDEGISWNQASEYAESMKSTLVFINDAYENNIVYNMIKDRYHYGYYIGARSFSESPLNYKWCSYKGKNGDNEVYLTDSVKYSNWLPGEPNNTDGKEFYAIMPVGGQGKWNDKGTAAGINLDSGFVMETSLDILPASTYESDRKKYEYYNVSLPYTIAKEFCEAKGGHLATITSKEENNIIYNNFPAKGWQYYIGATDVEKENTFKWITGENFSYTNWNTGEPNNCYTDTAENYVIMDLEGKWNDYIGQKSYVGFIAEYDMQSEKPTTTPVPTKTPSVTVSPVISTPPISKPTQTPYAGYVMGDLDGDSKVSLSDVQIALKGALNIITLTDTQKKAASVISGNGQVTLQDVQMVLKIALNISIF